MKKFVVEIPVEIGAEIRLKDNPRWLKRHYLCDLIVKKKTGKHVYV